MENFNDHVILVGPRLRDLARSLGMSASALAGLLKNAGYIVERKRNPYLSPEHVKVIEERFVQAVKRLVSRVKARIKKGDADQEECWYNLRVYLEQDGLGNSLEINYKNWEVDEEAARRKFQWLIYTCTVRSNDDNSVQSRIFAVFRSRIVIPILNIKKLILSKISPTLFFSYQGEDDDHAMVHTKLDFGVSEILFALEVFINSISNHLMELTRDGKIRSSQRTNRKMRFTC